MLSIHKYIETVDKIKEFDAESRPIHWKLGGLLTNPNPIPYSSSSSQKSQKRFTTLSVKVVKEVVSLDLDEQSTINMLKAGSGKHLTPKEFHIILAAHIEADNKVDNISTIATAATSSITTNNDDTAATNTTEEDVYSTIPVDSNTVSDSKKLEIKKNLLLLDVRNYYETRIGKFQLGSDSGSNSVIDPQTRQVRVRVRVRIHATIKIFSKKMKLSCF
jgi:hypothetical protein